MKSKKRILFVIWSFSMGGGAEKILSNILNNIDLNKYEIDVLEYIRFNIKLEEIPKEVRKLRPILDCSLKRNRIKRYVFDKFVIRWPWLFRKIFIKEDYDLEIAFNYLIPNALVHKSKKSFCWVHGDIYDLKNSAFLYKKQYKFFSCTDKIIVISNNTHKSVSELYPEFNAKISRIYNGFDLDLIKEASLEKCETKLNDTSVVFIGRLDEGKQPISALKCIYKLNKEFNFKAHIYILGKGELLGKLEEYVISHDLLEFVHFLGYINNPYPIIKQAKAIISFSKSEGFPTIFVEGLTLGVPFVCTPVGGAEELYSGGKTGIIVSDIDEGVLALKKIFEGSSNLSSSKCMGLANKFSIENQINLIEGMIDDE